MNTPIECVVLDMAGTTVIDDGLVVEAFTRAWDRVDARGDRDDAIDLVRATMGQSKIDVFRRLVDEDAAQRVNAAFEEAFDDLVAEGRCVPVPRAEDVLRQLGEQGRAIVLTTGFARTTADAIVARLGWGDLVDAVLTPADAGRGRPFPDLNLTALLRTEASSVDALAVVGDTPSDAMSGTAAGAGLVVGVLSGASTADDLEGAGADVVLGSVAELPALLERLGR